MTNNLFQLIIAGFGGQGILFCGKLLAQAAMLEDKFSTMFPSYGAEIRGGTANCTVIISDEMIGSPIVKSPNMLMIMNEASMKKFESVLKPGGLLIMNESLIGNSSTRSDIKTIRVKATEIAVNLGNSQIANMVMLGAFIAETGIIHPDTVLSVLKDITPSHRKNIMSLNKKAFQRGFRKNAH
jgi:2-oxoglutarate ferredoxin oxidoreductase subunit gamma